MDRQDSACICPAGIQAYLLGPLGHFVTRFVCVFRETLLSSGNVQHLSFLDQIYQVHLGPLLPFSLPQNEYCHQANGRYRISMARVDNVVVDMTAVLEWSAYYELNEKPKTKRSMTTD